MAITCVVHAFGAGVGPFDFDAVPRQGDYVVLPNGFRWRVEQVIFYQVGSKPHTVDLYVAEGVSTLPG